MLKYLISTSKMKNRIQIKIDKQRLRPIDADLQVPDTRKFKKHTGWKPEYTFKQTMDDLLNYWREQINSGNKFLDR
jgi:GDPmannose 4,6-dehydratase